MKYLLIKAVLISFATGLCANFALAQREPFLQDVIVVLQVYNYVKGEDAQISVEVFARYDQKPRRVIASDSRIVNRVSQSFSQRFEMPVEQEIRLDDIDWLSTHIKIDPLNSTPWTFSYRITLRFSNGEEFQLEDGNPFTTLYREREDVWVESSIPKGVSMLARTIPPYYDLGPGGSISAYPPIRPMQAPGGIVPIVYRAKPSSSNLPGQQKVPTIPNEAAMIEEARKAFKPALLTFNTPREMEVGKTEVFEVRITLHTNGPMIILTTDLKGRGDPTVKRIEVGSTVEVNLAAPEDEFKITPITPGDSKGRAINPERAYESWVWSIRPLKSGDHNVFVTVRTIATFPELGERSLNIENYAQTIHVKVTGRWAWEWTKTNWQVLLSSLIFPLVLAGWKLFTWFRETKEKKSQENQSKPQGNPSIPQESASKPQVQNEEPGQDAPK